MTRILPHFWWANAGLRAAELSGTCVSWHRVVDERLCSRPTFGAGGRFGIQTIGEKVVADTDVGTRVCELFRRVLQVRCIDVDIALLDYGIDSVRSAELVIELEQEFGIEVGDDVAATLQTTRDVIDHVAATARPVRIGA